MTDQLTEQQKNERATAIDHLIKLMNDTSDRLRAVGMATYLIGIVFKKEEDPERFFKSRLASEKLRDAAKTYLEIKEAESEHETK